MGGAKSLAPPREPILHSHFSSDGVGYLVWAETSWKHELFFCSAIHLKYRYGLKQGGDPSPPLLQLVRTRGSWWRKGEGGHTQPALCTYWTQSDIYELHWRLGFSFDPWTLFFFWKIKRCRDCSPRTAPPASPTMIMNGGTNTTMTRSPCPSRDWRHTDVSDHCFCSHWEWKTTSILTNVTQNTVVQYRSHSAWLTAHESWSVIWRTMH